MSSSKNLLKNMNQYLCPPGNGVFTVHTARENKVLLHKSLYNETDIEKVQSTWNKSIEQNLDKNDKPYMLGVTLDTGGGIQRGANWGPLFIRTKLDHDQYYDLGDVRTIPHLLHDKYLNDETITNCRNSLYQENSNLPVSALSITETFCSEFYQNFSNKKLIGLGGDHSVSYALVAPWIKAKRALGKKVAVIHFDAHTDLMPHRLGIDVCFASWAYHMLELLDSPSHMLQFGIRSSGQERNYWESNLGVQQFWAQEIKDNLQSVTDKTIKYLKEHKIDEVYISFDIDALDAQYASATGTPEFGGLEPHSCLHIIEEIAKVTNVTGADLVEVAPFVKSTHYKGLTPEPDTTLESAKTIIQKFIEVM